MCSGDAKAAFVAGDESQDFGALLNLEAVCAEILPLLVLFGNRRGVDYKCRLLVAECVGNKLGILLEVNVGSLFYELVGEGAGCPVVSGHLLALGEKVSYECAHSYASGTEEIY